MDSRARLQQIRAKYGLDEDEEEKKRQQEVENRKSTIQGDASGGDKLSQIQAKYDTWEEPEKPKPQKKQVQEEPKEQGLMDRVKSAVTEAVKQVMGEFESPIPQDQRITNPQQVQQQNSDLGFQPQSGQSAQMTVTPQSMEQQKQAVESMKKSPFASMGAGIGDVIQTTGGVARWMGADGLGTKLSTEAQGWQMMAAPDELGEFEWKMLYNPTFYSTRVARGVPFSLALMPAAILGAAAGGATAGVIGLGAIGRLILGSIGAATLSRPLEAALEAGSAYDEMIAKGKSPEEADKAANKVFAGNVSLASLDAAEFAAAFLPTKGGRFAKIVQRGGGVIAGVGLEGGEEVAQLGIGQVAQGEKLDLTGSEAQESFVNGAIMGTGLSTAGAIYRQVQDRVIEEIPEIQQKYAEKIKQGMTPEQAEFEAINEYADKNAEKLQQIVDDEMARLVPETKEELALDQEEATDSLKTDVAETIKKKEDSVEAGLSDTGEIMLPSLNAEDAIAGKTLSQLKFEGKNTYKPSPAIPLKKALDEAMQKSREAGSASVGQYDLSQIKPKNGRVTVYHGTRSSSADRLDGNAWRGLKDGAYVSLTKGDQKESLGNYGAGFYAKQHPDGRVVALDIPIENLAVDKITGELRYVDDTVSRVAQPSLSGAQQSVLNDDIYNEILEAAKKDPDAKDAEGLAKDLFERYKKAEVKKQQIDTIIEEVASEIPGASTITTPLKGFYKDGTRNFSRAVSKLARKGEVKDLARNTLLINTPEDALLAKQKLKERGVTIPDGKDFFDKPSYLGYRGVNGVEESEGNIGEIQVNIPEVIFYKHPENEAKDILGDELFNKTKEQFEKAGLKAGQGHVIYEEVQKYEKAAEKRGDKRVEEGQDIFTWTEEEEAILVPFIEESNKGYSLALDLAAARSLENSSSESKRPSRMKSAMDRPEGTETSTPPDSDRTIDASSPSNSKNLGKSNRAISESIITNKPQESKDEVLQTKEAFKNALEAQQMIVEMLFSGEVKAARETYDSFKEDNLPLASFEMIEELVEDTKRVEQEYSENEAKAIREGARAANPDDPTNQLLDIADEFDSILRTRGKILELTGKSRTITDTKGNAFRLGGDLESVLDRLIYAGDIDSFSKNMRILAVNFGHTKGSFPYVEINSKLDNIDGADFQVFKDYFAELRGNKRGTKAPVKRERPTLPISNTSRAQTQNPIGTGRLKESRAYSRIKDRLDEMSQLDVNYNVLKLEEDAISAMQFVATEPKKALRIARGLENPPPGQTETAISIALADKFHREGNDYASSIIEASLSLRSTRRGQEIVSLRGRTNDNSPYAFIQEVMASRLEILGKQKGNLFQNVTGTPLSKKQMAVKYIDQEAKKLSQAIKKASSVQEDLQSFIDEITCA